MPVAPSDTTGRQLKTVDKPVAPSLPGTSAYRQQILKEKKLGPLPADDPRQRRPDISQATRDLGWHPNVPLADGLKQTIAYFDGLLSAKGRKLAEVA